MDTGDEGGSGSERQTALARSFRALQDVLDRVPAEFPDAFGGTYGGPDATTVLVVEGAPGADELVATIRAAEQRSLDQVGVSIRFSFAPTRLPLARLDEVRSVLARELVAHRGLATIGLNGVGLGGSVGPGGTTGMCLVLHAFPGSGSEVLTEATRRFPDVPLQVHEAGPGRTRPFRTDRSGPIQP